MAVYALGLGLATKSAAGNILEVYYHRPLLNPKGDWVGAVSKAAGLAAGQSVAELTPAVAAEISRLIPDHPHWQECLKTPVLTLLQEDSVPTNAAEAYLKLHLISHRLAKPHGTNLTGVFKVLPNVAWTNEGAIAIDELPERQMQARLKGELLSVNCVDKFPKMTDYVVPAGVRIAHTARVRLGAYVGEGTTIMHEGFVNFNAGCEGPNMIEGRISAGVFVGSGSDLGGGCSTMGTLSGGNDVVISIGKNCLIGANAGCGIPLGDNCTIEAGLYVTGGSKIKILDKDGSVVSKEKAGKLAGVDNVLFRRNSLDGSIECKPLKSAVVLNDELHSNN